MSRSTSPSSTAASPCRSRRKRRHRVAESLTNDPPALPPDATIILPVRNFVLFPGVVMPVAVMRPKSVGAAQQALRDQRQIGIVMQKDASVDDPRGDDLYRMGCIANILRYVTAPDGSHHLVCQGDQRF